MSKAGELGQYKDLARAVEGFFLFTATGPALGSPSLLFSVYLGVKWLVHEADQSPPFSDKVKNV
jgi:hypothetical protein